MVVLVDDDGKELVRTSVIGKYTLQEVATGAIYHHVWKPKV